MSAVCPNGHTSEDLEWCDTCGAPMAGTPAAVPAPAPVASSVSSSASTAVAPVSCPHCGSMNSADNLFCESCGYDFTTGQSPDPVEAPTPAAVDPAFVEPQAGTWIVVVEVDTAWHDLKGELADRALPPPSTSTIAIGQHASLIGRTSQSRGLRPEIALDADTAVSRRHAQLILEGDKLSVVDLSSTNGTFVLDKGAAPTADSAPLAPGVSAFLEDGDLIFLGAWSRLTVRHT
ncbi:MAG: phosphopeptide-binding protein [Ilumatobacteraceae bacterium]|nr:phosphopeptide-binding protein [Ilumatobacteraceae bacterium]